MTLYVVSPASPEQKLSNSRNTFVIGGAASAAAARTAAELLGNVPAGAFALWNSEAMVDAASHSFVADVSGPIGRSGSPWNILTQAGDPLPA